MKSNCSGSGINLINNQANKDTDQMKRKLKLIMLVAMIAALTSGAVNAQNNQEPAASPPQPQQAENAMTDLRLLGLMPDQIQKIRAINFELKDQRQAAV